MKKWIIVTLMSLILSTLLLTALLTVYFTNGFTKNILTGKIYRPQNVYEEIWNLVVTEEHTKNLFGDTEFSFGKLFDGLLPMV